VVVRLGSQFDKAKRAGAAPSPLFPDMPSSCNTTSIRLPLMTATNWRYYEAGAPLAQLDRASVYGTEG
jgi:hypothetical protein